MAIKDFLLPGLELTAGLLPGGGVNTSGVNTGVNTGVSTGKTVNTTTLPGNAQNLQDTAIEALLKRLTADPGLKGLEQSQSNDINRMAQLRSQNAVENLAARGVTGGAQVANVENVSDAQRFADITKVRQQTPLLAHQMEGDTLGQVNSFLSQVPKTTTQNTFGSNTSNTSNTTSGKSNETGSIGEGIGNVAELLAYLSGKGTAGNLGIIGKLLGIGGTGGGGIADAAKGAVSPELLAKLGGTIPGGGNTVGGAANAVGGGSAVGNAMKSVRTLGGLVPAAAGIPIIGGAIAGAMLLPKAFGRGRKQADKLTGEGGLQANFNESLYDIYDLSQSGQISTEQRNQLIQQLYAQLKTDGAQFASGGSQQAKVVAQMLQHYKTNPVTADALRGVA